MTASRIIHGFVAGALAVLVFHQAALLALHVACVAPAATPWDLAPVPPFGVPAVASAAFWGGAWGVVFALLAPRFGRGAGYWLASLLFGAVVLTLVAWFVVLPLKGLPAGGGFAWPGVIVGPIVNGAWGLGTALLLAALPGARPRR
jgi:hypothetical protein